jgi:hypothetical protein
LEQSSGPQLLAAGPRPYVRPMPWSTRFPAPIILKDGRTIATLGQARAFMLTLPEQSQSDPTGNMQPSL